MKKYELIKDDFIKIGEKHLYRIRAVRDFGIVKAGDIGGYIENEENLSHNGDCWVFENGCVSDHGRVSGNGKVCDNGWVFGHSWVYDNGWVFGHGRVYDDGRVSGFEHVKGEEV